VLFRDPRVGLCTAEEREKKTGAGDLYDGLMLLSGNWMYHWAGRRSNRRACTD